MEVIYGKIVFRQVRILVIVRELCKNEEKFSWNGWKIVLLIVDSYYFVYCKNEMDFKVIYQNAVNNNFENIRYIDENDQIRW